MSWEMSSGPSVRPSLSAAGAVTRCGISRHPSAPLILDLKAYCFDRIGHSEDHSDGLIDMMRLKEIRSSRLNDAKEFQLRSVTGDENDTVIASRPQEVDGGDMARPFPNGTPSFRAAPLHVSRPLGPDIEP